MIVANADRLFPCQKLAFVFTVGADNEQRAVIFVLIIAADDAPDGDYTGYDFWLTKLNAFNGNFVAAEMVKAFMTSSEYRQRFGP